MHELSLAGSVLQIVEAAARREAFSRVRSLHLSVPALGGVELDALRFALRAIAAGTLLAGADLQLDTPPSRARCFDCGESFGVSEREALCPHCASTCWQTQDDTPLRVVDLVVE